MIKICALCKTEFVGTNHFRTYCPFCKSRYTESQLYYQSHPEQRKKQIRSWYQNNKEKQRLAVHLYRLKQKAVLTEINQKLKEMRFEDINEQYC